MTEPTPPPHHRPPAHPAPEPASGDQASAPESRAGRGARDGAAETSGAVRRAGTVEQPGRTPRPGRPPQPPQPPRTPNWFPAAFVGVGVLVLALTARSNGGLDVGYGAGWARSFRPPFAILTIVMFVWLAASYAKHRDDGYGLLRRAGSACAVILGGAAILVPLGLLALGHEQTAQPPLPDPTPTGTRTGGRSVPPSTIPSATGKPGHQTPGWVTTLAQFVVAALVMAVVAAAVVLIVNAIRRSRFAGASVRLAEFGDLGDADGLADAVAAAAEALDHRGDTREAVIACYAAMEKSIAEAGVGRQSTDTPEDLLRRARVAGLVPGESGTRLTELFREARFSHHPMTGTHRDAARAALAEISEHLRELAAAKAAKDARAAVGS